MIYKKNHEINDHLNSETKTTTVYCFHQPPKRKLKLLQSFTLFFFFLFSVISCNKLVDIPPPANTIVTEQAFNSDNNANAAISGIYSKLLNQDFLGRIGNGGLTIYTGLSSDELVPFSSSSNENEFFRNSLLETNSIVFSNFWQPAYSSIYQINTAIEQIPKSSGLSSRMKNRLLGEANFLRAFCYFHLINLFGDVPFIEATAWENNLKPSRLSITDVYNLVIADLKTAKDLLPSDFSEYNNERIRATKYAAMALLARVYLYLGRWNEAEIEASEIINSSGSLFSLKSNLKDIFLKNSTESILQWRINTSFYPNNVTPESELLLPANNANPNYYLSQFLLNDFSTDSVRKKFWIDSITYLGTKYFFPAKYKIGPNNRVVNGTPNEYYMILRLAEQFLIRAEAKAQQQNLSGAATDLNTIRARAGLSAISFASKEDAIDKIFLERRKELFCEWGHRWFDLKRSNKMDSIMTAVTATKGGSWSPNWKLYPIPFSEINLDQNLNQNLGY